jgi:hypothetical protein
MPSAPTLSKLPSSLSRASSKDTGNTTADNNVTPSNEPGVFDVDYETEVMAKKTETELMAKKDIFNFMRNKVTEKEPEEHREPETVMAEELKGQIVSEKVVTVTAPEQFKNESNAKKKTKTKKNKKSKSPKARKIVQNVEHLFEPSEIPLERTVSDTEVYLVSMAYDDEDVAEAYELVKPATWNGVETQYEDSEDEDDDSVVTHLSGIDEDDFGKRSKCGLTDNLHDTLLCWGEAMYNMCPEPNEQGKKSMMENARQYEEAAYVMRDLSRGKL